MAGIWGEERVSKCEKEQREERETLLPRARAQEPLVGP